MARIIDKISRLIMVSPFLMLGGESLQQEAIASICRMAYASRDDEALALAIPHLNEPMRRFYRALQRNEWGEASVFDFDSVEDKYKPRVLLGHSICYRVSGDTYAASNLLKDSYNLALRTKDYYGMYCAQKGFSLLCSEAGDHKTSLEYLERVFPIVSTVSRIVPAVYYDYLNNLAVELAEIGDLNSARNCIERALSSQLRTRYPEWQETRDGIALRGYRSSSSIVVSKPNVLLFSQQGEAILRATPKVSLPYVNSNSEIINLSKWKTVMAGTKAKEQKKEIDLTKIKKMDRQSKQREIMEAILDKATTEDDLNDFLKYLAERRKPGQEEK